MHTESNVAAYDLHTRIRAPLITSMLLPRTGERILDLGSGNGFFSELISKAHASIVCLDIFPENLRSIKRHSAAGLLLVNSDAEYTPFKDSAFDKILCSEVLEHVEADTVVLREIVRILKPGGVLVMTVPCSDCRFLSLIGVLGIRTVHDFEGPEKHFRPGYAAPELSKLLQDAGIEVAEQKYFCHFFSQLILDMITLGHLFVRRVIMRQKAWNWSDIQNLNASAAFSVYKLLFPLLLLATRLDRLFFSSSSRGTGLAVKAVKNISRK